MKKNVAAATVTATNAGKTYFKMGKLDGQKTDFLSDSKDHMLNLNFKPNEDINPKRYYENGYGSLMKMTKTNESELFCSFCGYGSHQCGGCTIMPRIRGARSKDLNTQYKKR